MFFGILYLMRNHHNIIDSFLASILSLIARKKKASAFSDRDGCLFSPTQDIKTHFFPIVTAPQPQHRKESVLSPIRRYVVRRTSFFTSLFSPLSRFAIACRKFLPGLLRRLLRRLLRGLLRGLSQNLIRGLSRSFFRRHLRCPGGASLTVEAALELPLFFVLTAIILQYACVMRTAAQYSGSLTTTAQEMAVAAYKEQYGDANKVLRAALSDAWATAQVINTAKDKDAVRYASFLNSSYLKENNMIKLVLSYQPRPKYTPLSLPLTFFVQKAAVRGWIGKDGRSGRKKKEKGDNSQNRTVYVTEHGSVFHTNPDCSHLKVTIIPVTRKQLEHARNVSGGKYKKCPHCGSQRTDQYYVDPYGSCWHTSVECSHLKRTVHEKDMEECGHMHECKDCRDARRGGGTP